MDNLLYLLLVSLGALLMLSVFHFTIFLQQKDKAFFYYSLYLFTMSIFTVVRLLDERLTQIYPLSYRTIATLDPLLSNLSFLMYVNFLGVTLEISPKEKLYYYSWRALQLFVLPMLGVYTIFQLNGVDQGVCNAMLSVNSFFVLIFGALLVGRLFTHLKDTFHKLILTGTTIAVAGVLSGIIVNTVVYDELINFHGLYFMLPAMLVEMIFLSAALGYRIKVAYQEKARANQLLIDEVKRSEQLAIQTAQLLKNELSIQQLQNRICKDLHDDVGASLSSIQIYSTVAERLIDGQNSKVKQVLQQISANAQQVLENMGDIIWSMKTDDSSEFSKKIKDAGYDLLTASDINCSYSIPASINDVLTDIGTRRNLFLVIKEAFNNMAKYSKATTAAITISIVDEKLLLVISDNGIGYDLQKIKKVNGIQNIRERINLMQGSCTIESVPGEGTTISSCIPLTTISDTTKAVTH